MILLLFLLSVVDLSLSQIPAPLGSPVFILSCKADGLMQTTNVILNMTAKIEDSLQSVAVQVNCSNGYRNEVRSNSDFQREYKIKIPAVEIYCMAKVTYFDYWHGDNEPVSYENCEFPVPAPTVSVDFIGSKRAGSSVSLECNVTAVKGINGSVDIIWTRDDGEGLTEYDVDGYPVNNTGLLLYTSLYNITMLQMTDDNTTYHCQAVINTSPLVNNSDSYTLNVLIPTPNVTIVALDDQTIGTPLSLRCDVTAVMGINSTIEFVWMKDDKEILRENDTKGDPTNNATMMLYTSHYYNNVTTLRMTDDNTSYHCQAIINASPVVNSSDSYTLNVIVPAPNVTINVLSDDQSLRCDVTTVMGINRSVDILWMKDDTEVLRESDAAGDPINNATLMLYRSHYHYYRNVSANTSYRCQAIINTSPVVNNSDSYNLHVIDVNQTTVTPSSTVYDSTTATPSSETFNTDYHQIALILALVGFVCTVIVLLLFFGLFLCKNRSKLSEKLTNSQDEHMDICNFDDTDYSVIGREKESMCEYLGNNSKNVPSFVDNMNSKLQKLEEECISLSFDNTTTEEMLNHIHGFSETDTDTQHVASDLESHDQDNDLHDLESMVNGSKDAGYVTSNEQDDTSHDTADNEDCAVLQQDATPSYIHENAMYAGVNIQSNCNPPINLTSQNNNSVFTSAYVKIVPGLQDGTVKMQDNNFTDTSQRLMEVAFPAACVIPSTSHGSYLHYSAAINHLPSSTTAIEGDYIDYHISIAQQSTMPNLSFQSTDQSMLHVPLQDFKDESSNSGNDEVNAMQPAQSTYVDPEMMVPSDYPIDSEMEGGQYIEYDTAVQQGIGQNVHLEQNC